MPMTPLRAAAEQACVARGMQLAALDTKPAFRAFRAGTFFAHRNVGDASASSVGQHTSLQSGCDRWRWAAGALTSAQYRRLLADAGFARVEIDIRQRYTAADMLAYAPDALAALPAAVVDELVGRFTSSSVTAWKPAE